MEASSTEIDYALCIPPEIQDIIIRFGRQRSVTLRLTHEPSLFNDYKYDFKPVYAIFIVLEDYCKSLWMESPQLEPMLDALSDDSPRFKKRCFYQTELSFTDDDKLAYLDTIYSISKKDFAKIKRKMFYTIVKMILQSKI